MSMRRATAAMLLCLTAACTAVRPVATPQTFIPERQPPVVWVASPEGEVLAVSSPTVQGDSVRGTLAGTSEPVAFPLTPQYPVMARQKDTKKTVQLVALLGVAAGLATWGFIEGGSGDKICNPATSRYC